MNLPSRKLRARRKLAPLSLSPPPPPPASLVCGRASRAGGSARWGSGAWSRCAAADELGCDTRCLRPAQQFFGKQIWAVRRARFDLRLVKLRGPPRHQAQQCGLGSPWARAGSEVKTDVARLFVTHVSTCVYRRHFLSFCITPVML